MAATDEIPAVVLSYLRVFKAETVCETIEAVGWTVILDPFEIERQCTMALFEAHGGIVQVVWEPTDESVTSGHEATQQPTP